MIKIYDSVYLTECETENTKTDILLSETNKVSEVCNELVKAIKLCEKKYNTKCYYTRELLLGNTESKWNEDNTEIIVVRTYDKWYITIDWGSHSYFIKIAFDTEKEYKDYIKINYDNNYDNDDFEDDCNNELCDK